jgi:aarF domain-containing kinase
MFVQVAIKIQRPSIESKLMGDIANLKALAKPLREVEAMPLDYYKVFAELEAQLEDEFDFVAEYVLVVLSYIESACFGRDLAYGEMEKCILTLILFLATYQLRAAAMDRIYTALSRTLDGSARADIPLKIPRPVPGLISKRVLVMDYLKGVPLSR